ncbi:hypothetical protein P4O66_014791 [Electrophorus voltai]|uniref:VWFA domain-containing protein n=1 Tax=Electrophorus voltai TaxID=2609070 RepID=A0AAD8Z439_9TELE|nr:hypothetical protein P4O66_014791 [Electrophorus voltai]
MPGLKNRATWAPLLLKSSHITSCANGCSLGIKAHLTYVNTELQPVEGVFVYPLGEQEVVVGFEALVSGRLLGVELQGWGSTEPCCLRGCPGAACPSSELGCCGRTGLNLQCPNGHLLLDEDLERTTFIIGTGLIAPMEMMSVVISTTVELPTLENGAIHLIYPTVLTPIVRARMPSTKSENGGRSEETRYLCTSGKECHSSMLASSLSVSDGKSATRCFRAVSIKQEKVSGADEHCHHVLFSSPATNPTPYELTFQLLVRGACLLAGLESPTHALRADADPGAQSAFATYITLAEDHPYDRHLEIVLHLSEPHSPLVILERGRLTFSQYEQQISARRDFIRCVRKEAEPEKKLEFVRKRYHKDVLNNPVLMLNFCPDLISEPLELQQTSREVIFLIDCSGTTTQHCLCRIREALLVATKGLPHGVLLNIVSFGSTVRPVFTSSKPCTDLTLAQVFDYVQKLCADMGASNLLGALSWVYRQPVQRSCPRQILILTAGSLGCVGRVLELVRRNTCNGRCFGLGLGPRACRRLLQGVSRVTGGSSEFLCEEERLQPKLIKCVKKALEPALTDVHIDWYVPDNVEALLSPNEIPPLYPGNLLIGYCTLYDVSAFKVKKNEGHSSRLPGRGSSGSVFETSPATSELLQPLVQAGEEGQGAEPDDDNREDVGRGLSREISSEFSCAPATDITINTSNTIPEQDWVMSSVRRRMETASYVQEQYMLTRCSLDSDRALPTLGPPAESLLLGSDSSSLPQGLEKVLPPHTRGLSRWESPWQQSTAPSVDAGSGKRALARCALAARSFSSPQGDLDMHRLRRALERVSFEQTIGDRLEETDTETHSTPRAPLSVTDSSEGTHTHTIKPIMYGVSVVQWFSILLANVQSLDNNPDDLRARIKFQRDIRDCNLLCFTESWLNPAVPSHAIQPAKFFSVHRMDRTADLGKLRGSGVYVMVNNSWCNNSNVVTLACSCSPNLELLKFRPFYFLPEFTSHTVYIPPRANKDTSLCELHESLTQFQVQHQDAALIVVGDFNSANLKRAVPNLYQHVTFPTRGNRTLDHCYTPYKDSYKAQAHPPFGKSDHAAIFLIPKYKQRLKREAPVQREVVRWTDQLVAALQDALDDADWDMFRCSTDDVSEFTEAVVGFIGKLVDDTIPRATIKMLPNQKPWVDKTICEALNSRTAAYNAGIISGNMDEYKSAAYGVRRATTVSTGGQLRLTHPHPRHWSSPGLCPKPLLYSLYTYDCTATSSSTIIVKFADDTVVIGLILDNDERAYLEEIKHLENWCQENNLLLNVSKTKELIVDCSKKQERHYQPVRISGNTVERVDQVPWSSHLAGPVLVPPHQLPGKEGSSASLPPQTPTRIQTALQDGHLFPASPLDWDNFADPEGLFTAAPGDESQAVGVPCRSVIHGMLGTRPVSWEVSVDLAPLWDPEGLPSGPWDEIVHQLTAQSVIRDFENMAEKETDIEHGLSRSAALISSSTSSTPQRSSESRSFDSFFGSRFNLGRLKNSYSSGRQAPLKPQCLSAESDTPANSESPDYLPLVRLQLASGAFLLSSSFSECIDIPLDRVKRASPYLSHRSSLSLPCTARPIAPYRPEDRPAAHLRQACYSEPLAPEEGSLDLMGRVLQADSGRGSETDMCERSPLEVAELQGEELAQLDVESSSWATAVALAWLEHHCAGFFVEWELVAAKADFWLKCQSLPEGVDLPGLKAAARQMFLLLRHWDENLQLNVLCYNPNNM